MPMGKIAKTGDAVLCIQYEFKPLLEEHFEICKFGKYEVYSV
jgi:hypothetical protein